MAWLPLVALLTVAQATPDRGRGLPANCNLDPADRPAERPYNNVDDDCDPETRDDDLDRDGLIFTEDCDDERNRGDRLSAGDVVWPSAQPPCPEGAGPLTVKGDLVIATHADSLADLHCVCAVLGNLDLTGNRALTSLDGLENLERVDGSLRLRSTSRLVDTSGLGGLVRVGGDVDLRQNAALQRVAGFEGLRTVGGSVAISDNEALQALEAFDALAEISGDLEIHSNDKLQAIDALEQLAVLGEDVQISDNRQLQSMEALDALERIAGEVDVHANGDMSDVELVGRLIKTGLDFAAQNGDEEEREGPPPLVAAASDAVTNRSWVPRLFERMGGVFLVLALVVVVVPGGLASWWVLREYLRFLDDKRARELLEDTQRPAGYGAEHFEHLTFEQARQQDPDVPPPLRGLPDAQVLEFKQLTAADDVDYGFTLLLAGHSEPAAIWLVDAAVVCEIDGMEVATLPGGAVVGAIALVEDAESSIDVRVGNAGRISVLERQAYDKLVAENHPVIPILEHGALVSQARTLRGLHRRVAAGARGLHKGEPQDAPRVEMRQRVRDWVRTAMEEAPSGPAVALHQAAALQGVPHAFVDQLEAQARRVTFTPGQTLFHQTQENNDLWFILQGQVDLLLALSEPFTPLPVDRVGPGDLLGATEVFTRLPRSCSAVACSTGSALVIDGEAASRLAALTHPVGHSLRVAWLRALEASCRQAAAEIRGREPDVGQARWLGPLRKD